MKNKGFTLVEIMIVVAIIGIIIVIAIFATLYFFSSSDDVVYKDLVWKSRDGIYTASFTVNNKTKNLLKKGL